MGINFKRALLNQFYQLKKIILDNNKTLRFEDLTPIEFSEYLLKEYGYSASKAIEALEILTPDQLESLRKRYTTGGK